MPVPTSQTPPFSISPVVTDRLAPGDTVDFSSTSDIHTLNSIAMAALRAVLT